MPYQDAVRSSGLYDVLEPAYAAVQRRRWVQAGGPVPPPSAVKRQVLVQYAQQYGIRTLVETGTYRADTVRALRRNFDRIYSIELAPDFYAKALHRCRRQSNARLLLGDSGTVLPELMKELMAPALFWLDAHASGGETAEALAGEAAPIERELDAILGGERCGHVALIDDAREFHASATTGYPPVGLLQTVADRHSYVLTEAADSFRLVPAVVART